MEMTGRKGDFVMKNLKSLFVMAFAFSVVATGSILAAGDVVMTVIGSGEFTNDAALMIDGSFLPEQTLWDDAGCVYWVKKDVFFTIDMGTLYQINNITIQSDHNDTYQLEYSENGDGYSPLMTIKANVERVDYGMKTISTDSAHEYFLDGTGFTPVNARFVRLAAVEGDEAYSVSEIRIARGIPQAKPEAVKESGAMDASKESKSKVVSTLMMEENDPAAGLDMKITGYGEFNGVASLMIDGILVDNETTWDDKRCVTWTGIDTYFVIDFGALYQIRTITLDADHNDTYTIEYSADGNDYAPLFTLMADAGVVETGIERVSTDPTDPDYLKDSAFQPVMAQYLKIRAIEGDDAYSIAEIGVRKTKN